MLFVASEPATVTQLVDKPRRGVLVCDCKIHPVLANGHEREICPPVNWAVISALLVVITCKRP